MTFCDLTETFGSDSLDFFILEGLAEPQSCVPYDHIGFRRSLYRRILLFSCMCLEVRRNHSWWDRLLKVIRAWYGHGGPRSIVYPVGNLDSERSVRREWADY